MVTFEVTRLRKSERNVNLRPAGRSGRAVECTGLENRHTGDRIGGSNPSSSAFARQCSSVVGLFYCIQVGLRRTSPQASIGHREMDFCIKESVCLRTGRMECEGPTPLETSSEVFACPHRIAERQSLLLRPTMLQRCRAFLLHTSRASADKSASINRSSRDGLLY